MDEMVVWRSSVVTCAVSSRLGRRSLASVWCASGILGSPGKRPWVSEGSPRRQLSGSRRRSPPWDFSSLVMNSLDGSCSYWTGWVTRVQVESLESPAGAPPRAVPRAQANLVARRLSAPRRVSTDSYGDGHQANH